jgi:DNA-3-methyladenine glycosylase
MKKVLSKRFFDRTGSIVAEELLGKFLVRTIRGKEIALTITETEAYCGFDDLASHARFGKTVRTAPMFEEAGTIYIYFTYGMHWMLNLVCGARAYPSAVLIRAAGGVVGPARLTRALEIDKTLNNKVLGKKSGLWVEDRGTNISARTIKKTARIGIAYAGEWVDKPLRFVLEEESSKKKRTTE